ncbi:hypothetical protein [Yeosuana sp.]|uniref:hypothetical protein n=1 Tax=Yeosuana sp. TaxID=2529388 RepID=UPI00405500F4|tara:strand:+ start:11217 stop:11732 length:516 start_codon:yes stop_codon:yes gene_type:complete
MKKITLILSILLFTLSVKAQITKGNWMFGGDAIIQGYKFKNSEKFNYYAEIFPKAGYFVIDKLVIGSEIGIFINSATFYTSFVPFTRYYLLSPEKTINPFIEGGLGFKNIKDKQDIDPTLTEFMYQFKLGTSIFFTNSVGLNVTLNYKNNSFQFDQEISVAFGFQIHLEKK